MKTTIKDAISKLSASETLTELEENYEFYVFGVSKSTIPKLKKAYFSKWVELSQNAEVPHDLDLNFMKQLPLDDKYFPIDNILNFIFVTNDKYTGKNIASVSDGFVLHGMPTTLEVGYYFQCDGKLYQYHRQNGVDFANVEFTFLQQQDYIVCQNTMSDQAVFRGVASIRIEETHINTKYAETPKDYGFVWVSSKGNGSRPVVFSLSQTEILTEKFVLVMPLLPLQKSVG